MDSNSIRKPKQIKLIIECRQSGLSDYQWCRKQASNLGTFYDCVSKLRKAGYTIPDLTGKVSGVPVMQAIPKGKEKDYTDPAVQDFFYCNRLFEYERSYRKRGLSYKQINTGEETTVSHHHQNVSAQVTNQKIFQVQETAVRTGGSEDNVLTIHPEPKPACNAGSGLYQPYHSSP